MFENRHTDMDSASSPTIACNLVVKSCKRLLKRLPCQALENIAVELAGLQDDVVRQLNL